MKEDKPEKGEWTAVNCGLTGTSRSEGAALGPVQTPNF